MVFGTPSTAQYVVKAPIELFRTLHDKNMEVQKGQQFPNWFNHLIKGFTQVAMSTIPDIKKMERSYAGDILFKIQPYLPDVSEMVNEIEELEEELHPTSYQSIKKMSDAILQMLNELAFVYNGRKISEEQLDMLIEELYVKEKDEPSTFTDRAGLMALFD